ncbi:hypothetical protein [Yoonia sp. MH D7]
MGRAVTRVCDVNGAGGRTVPPVAFVAIAVEWSGALSQPVKTDAVVSGAKIQHIIGWLFRQGSPLHR